MGPWFEILTLPFAFYFIFLFFISHFVLFCLFLFFLFSFSFLFFLPYFLFGPWSRITLAVVIWMPYICAYVPGYDISYQFRRNAYVVLRRINTWAGLSLFCNPSILGTRLSRPFSVCNQYESAIPFDPKSTEAKKEWDNLLMLFYLCYLFLFSLLFFNPAVVL